MSQARFQKQARERARREKQDAKRERREAYRAAAAETTESPSSAEAQQDVLADLADLHREFEAGTLDFVEFERRKQELTAQLDV